MMELKRTVATSRKVASVDTTVLSVKQVGRRLMVGERTARSLVKSGELKGHRIGRVWRVFETDLNDFLARNASRRPTVNSAVGGHAA